MEEMTKETRRSYAELVLEQCIALAPEDTNHSVSIEGILALTSLQIYRNLCLEQEPVSYFYPIVATAAKRLYEETGADDPELLHEEVANEAAQMVLRHYLPDMYKRAVDRIGPVRVWLGLQDFKMGRGDRILARHSCGTYAPSLRLDCGNPLLLDGSALKVIKRAGYDARRYKRLPTRMLYAAAPNAEEASFEGIRVELCFVRNSISIGTYSEQDLEDLYDQRNR